MRHVICHGIMDCDYTVRSQYNLYRFLYNIYIPNCLRALEAEWNIKKSVHFRVMRM